MRRRARSGKVTQASASQNIHSHYPVQSDLTAPLRSLTPFLTGKKCKIPNVYRAPNGLTAKNPWRGIAAGRAPPPSPPPITDSLITDYSDPRHPTQPKTPLGLRPERPASPDRIANGREIVFSSLDGHGLAGGSGGVFDQVFGKFFEER